MKFSDLGSVMERVVGHLRQKADAMPDGPRFIGDSLIMPPVTINVPMPAGAAIPPPVGVCGACGARGTMVLANPGPKAVVLPAPKSTDICTRCRHARSLHSAQTTPVKPKYPCIGSECTCHCPGFDDMTDPTQKAVAVAQ